MKVVGMLMPTFSFKGDYLMENGKTFKTYVEQVEILKSRNMIIDNPESAIRFLEINNYYNVINGYKAPFLKPKSNTEEYLDNVHFQDIIQLFNADKSLCSLFLNEIIRIERMIKSITAYQFTKQYGIQYDNQKQGGDYIYITPQYFNPDPSLHNDIIDFCNHLSKIRNDSLTKWNDLRIKHYDNFGYIPFWVFVSTMSLGDISIFYKLLKANDQINICNQLSSINQRYIDNSDTQNSLRIMNFVRNICAHDQRLFNFKTKCTLSKNNPLITHIQNSSPAGIVIAAAAISHFCNDAQYNAFYGKFLQILSSLINFYKDNTIRNKIIKSLKLNTIMNDILQL